MKKLILVVAGALLIAGGIRAQSPAKNSAYADYYGQYTFDSSRWSYMVDGAAILQENGSIKMKTHTVDKPGLLDFAGKHSDVETWRTLVDINNATLDMDMLGPDSFRLVYGNGTVLFKRGSNNKVTQIVVNVSGAVLTGEKQPAKK